MGVGDQPRPSHLISGKDPVPIVWEDGWAPGPVWTGAENLALTCIRSPDSPACSESQCRLSYSGPQRSPVTIEDADCLGYKATN